MAWTEREALEALHGSDLLAIGMESDQLRRELHPEAVVTYSQRAPAGLTLEAAAQQARSYGSGAVLLTHVAEFEDLALDRLEARMSAFNRASSSVTFHHLPATRLPGADCSTALARLHSAGLCSILLELPATQASALSPANTELLLHAAASRGMGVSIAYTIGRGESVEERVMELQSIRVLASTQAVQSVSVRIHHASTPQARREEEATAVDYLKTLAVARLFLDTIPHVTSEWEVMGPKVLELALRFGADDAGSVPWAQDPRVGPSHHGGEAELRRIIRDAGFRPVERDALFRQSLLR